MITPAVVDPVTMERDEYKGTLIMVCMLGFWAGFIAREFISIREENDSLRSENYRIKKAQEDNLLSIVWAQSEQKDVKENASSINR